MRAGEQERANRL